MRPKIRGYALVSSLWTSVLPTACALSGPWEETADGIPAPTGQSWPKPLGREVAQSAALPSPGPGAATPQATHSFLCPGDKRTCASRGRRGLNEATHVRAQWWGTACSPTSGGTTRTSPGTARPGAHSPCPVLTAQRPLPNQGTPGEERTPLTLPPPGTPTGSPRRPVVTHGLLQAGLSVPADTKGLNVTVQADLPPPRWMEVLHPHFHCEQGAGGPGRQSARGALYTALPGWPDWLPARIWRRGCCQVTRAGSPSPPCTEAL